jgi:hypothetical protein
MTGNRQPIRQRSWAWRLRRVALVAVLAIVSSAVLPLVHSATNHTGECAVCSVFAHSGASVADVVLQPVVSPLAGIRALVPLASVTVVTLRALDCGEARAPPVSSVSI